MVKVNSSGLPAEERVCTRCHEMLCAREWRADVWHRQMQ